MATPVGRGEFLIGKLFPYFLLGMGAMGLSVTAAIYVFNVPFRGSIWRTAGCVVGILCARCCRWDC